MCSAIARHLKPGCRFVTVNNNSNHTTDDFTSTGKYGVIKKAHGPLIDGTPVDYIIFLDDGFLASTNYHLSVETHEMAFSNAGFRQVKWHNPELSSQIEQSNERDDWSEFLNHPPGGIYGMREMIHDEDPRIRKMFQEQLAKEGAVFNMPEEAYR